MASARFENMRHLFDYALKIVMLFFVFARFLSGPTPESHGSSAKAVQEPSSDTQT
jgi:hypothetical protein